MKTIISVFVLLTTCSILHAQDTALVQPPALEQEISRERIQMRGLPEAVREALKAPDYAGWTVDTIDRSVMADREKPGSEPLVIYVVALRRMDERAVITFDKDGKRLDDDNRK